jgi:DNA-binding CsgD family transcriptional regulator
MQISDPMAEQLNPGRILLDLQQANQIAQYCSGCLDPAEIASRVTAGLVEKFDCAFARIWLLEPDQTALKLVASAGMYTHTNGSFARVPMGAYKVGKIAQNRVSFLSNNLANEPWVGNRAWAIANQMRGFAGYPLTAQDRVIGVLATFSHQPMQPEFLEVLQTLCTTVAIALDTAQQYQKESQQISSGFGFSQLALSDQFASILKSAHLTLVGTERSLSLPLAYLFLEAATLLNQVECDYCRLIYTEEAVALEAIVPSPDLTADLSGQDPKAWVDAKLGQLFFTVGCLGGLLQTSANRRSLQVTLRVPYSQAQSDGHLRVECQSPVLQLAFTHLACLAGLLVSNQTDIPLLTDDLTKISASQQVLWIQHGTQPLPKGIQAKVDLLISPDQLRQAVNAVDSGQLWGFDSQPEPQPVLSEREREILTCLTQGHRDRDVADRLIISESTVKFHIKNILAKLKVRTRYQALHQAIVNGWI